MEEIKIEKEKTILIVWDVINILVNSIYNKEEFINSTKEVIEFARKNNIPVVYTKIKQYPKGFEPKNISNMKWKSSTWKEGDFDLYIKPEDNELIIEKNTWSIFVGTNFELLLRNRNINNIIFTGIATEIGIETSARHAFALGFTPIIIEDAVSSSNKEGHNRSIENMKNLFITVKAKNLENIIK
ncbi:isochorismatase [Nanobdella aerobiophila]|uniref:Isochorismatase n=1 Tax=Nanobdella aerobiophila TaxID=2586965 RepID=A0A915WSB8_9ARCH|nr:isochorismatase family cysteine hydrolase [Nanobdella aerobiophila]BBL45776.1 isochorismatase [Nanobdella aerobiophila]